MIKYDDLYEIVKSQVSEKRFAHTLGVVDRAIEYAKIYGEDVKKVKLAALAHDIAKEISDDEARKYFDILDDTERKTKSLQHAKIGAVMCKEFGFDEDMINAVKYHTTGRENMSMLEKIVCLADATEEGRDEGKKYVELIKNDIDKGMFAVTSWGIKALVDVGSIIHIDTVKCYNFYNEKES